MNRADFVARYPFPLDRFQVDAIDVLDRGDNVVVAAPTASGKTVVADFGVARAVAAGRRAFYTTPLKALSNQKFRDMGVVYGTERVGLVTGDTVIQASAPAVVMTTEVLRNMIYGDSPALADLDVVVLDEVHFLQDTYRGPVWEEVIIHLPPEVQLVCLSATVSNARELADWIATVRGPTRSIVETRRPVRLDNRYLVADRTADRLRLLPMFVDGHPNRDALRLDESAVRGGPRRSPRRADERSGRRRLTPPTRLETLDVLAERELLPAIYFIFSRAACDDAARACLDAGLSLTTAEERERTEHIIADRLRGLATEDLEVLGFERYAAQLRAGFAAHHAGMIPAMKEVVEECFAAGCLKVVFATETLAVGINMPARTVVIEKLSKFTGDHHERLTPGEYTQLTGRAGRRGIDSVGDAVVLWSPWVRFDDVARLASSSTFQLRSAFRPTYNMAANLVQRYTSDVAHHLLNLSFAQFQSDRDIVRIETRIERQQRKLRELREAADSGIGDIEEYRRERKARQQQRSFSAGQMRGALARLRPGAIVRVDRGERRGVAVVIATAHRSHGVRLTVIDANGERRHAAADDFTAPPTPVGHIEMPSTFAPNRVDWRRQIGRRLAEATVDPAVDAQEPPHRPHQPHQDVERDPNLRARLDAAARAERTAREIADLEQRVRRKSRSLAHDFDQVLDLLEHLGYVDGGRFEALPAGEMLARVFHENDLLTTEMLRNGLLDGLGPADVAALVSCVVYEHRSADAPPDPWFSSKKVRARYRSLQALSDDLRGLERARGLAEHRPPDPTFAAIAFAWVAGDDFADVVSDEELTGGDFVRNTKQTIDLLRQIALVAHDPDTRTAAAAAAESATRGVVADSSVSA